MNHWEDLSNIGSKELVCGYCGVFVASVTGFYRNGIHPNVCSLRICPNCQKPTFFNGYEQVPGIAPGNSVESVPNEVSKLYNESRRCISINAFTASVLTSRKLLMNLAVSEKAETGKSFIFYVNFLAENGYVPPNGKGWVDHIRKKGNEATHEIVDMTREDAVELVSFAEMLLKFIYEFPARIPPSDS
ncbi:DUF4145 domain-containing protein [Salinicola halophyticus]|uniref:DUF4145 domain-containing protein n=1 Tax=Salinicola halophyticus TaxID=1808881 RepID=UPI000DA20F84|nr:DUF4145 domain-containing protein [Salinicola halophyticus]